jgi:hypothetical protein
MLVALCECESLLENDKVGQSKPTTYPLAKIRERNVAPSETLEKKGRRGWGCENCLCVCVCLGNIDCLSLDSFCPPCVY